MTAAPPQSRPTRPLLLAVDDDPYILKAIERILRSSPVEVVTVTSPVDALTLLGEREVGVVLTDYMMPGLDGMELLVLIRENWPDAICIMMTASPDVRVAADAVNRQLIDYFISKPWKSRDLVGLVEAASAKFRASRTTGTAPAAQEAGLFGKYQLIERIASGGMAELYRARLQGSAGFAKDLAVKKILPHLSNNPGFVQMFTNEAMIMVTLNHGNIVSVIDFGDVGGEHYLVMEYLDGPDLRRLLHLPGNRPNPLPPALACYVAQQILLGLDHAHRKTDPSGKPLEIVHRDIGSHNVLLSKDGAVKIADFGIAKAASRARITQQGMVRGTPVYMSPEQLCAEPVDHRADIYSAGIVLYEMLTGVVPFEGAHHRETVSLILRGAYAKPHTVSKKVDKRLSGIIHRALRNKPSNRYPSAGAMADELGDFLHKARLRPGASDLAAVIRERART